MAAARGAAWEYKTNLLREMFGNPFDSLGAGGEKS
jgi:hypothetical protein